MLAAPVPRSTVQTDEPPGASALTGDAAESVLRRALAAEGSTLRTWHRRGVHRRGSSSVAVVYEVGLTDREGTDRDRLLVAHVATRRVPGPTRRLRLDDGSIVHVWRFPHDPYLPGLPHAVHRRHTAQLLRDVGLGPVDEPALRTRSYRPTRRAVVEIRSADGKPPVAYLKVLGGRTPARVAARTRDLVTTHAHLGTVLPVPRVLEHDLPAGRALLGALPGATLRRVLRDGGELPDPAALADLLTTLHALPPPTTDADPDGFADVRRHVALLRPRLPERAAALDELAAAAAAVGGPSATVHGDLHDGQLLVVDGRIEGLLDVDGVGTGLVAHDLGRLLAHVDASALLAPDVAARAERYVADLRDAVADLAPPPDVAAAAAAAWVGLATGPLRVASPDWRAEAVARIDRGLRWARSAR